MTETRGSTATPERARPDRRGEHGRGPIARIGLFYRQVVGELRKVIWPTREQLTTYWMVVLVFVLVVIGIVSLLDLGIGWLTFKIFG
ncbi:MAG: preprotein translocase subunit SecE [Actinopolymorphaceae bacterium]